VIDDNPASRDLLGFDVVVASALDAIRGDDIGPLTIGIRGGWGTGKSTLLELIEAALAAESEGRFIVARLDPWEFESAEQMRSTLVEIVLTELQWRVREDEGALKKIGRLIGRVRFGKVAASLLKGAATVHFDGGIGLVSELVTGLSSDVDSFVSPPSENSLPATMHGFREEFRDLILDLYERKGIEKVVVLVDDLDRCLPDAVIETLEAIKLFLAVERMMFVLAADEEMVRSALAASLAASGRASAFADLYLEKIVQLPLTLPALTPDDAVTYVTLLLCAGGDQTAYEALAEHCRSRRASNTFPLLDDAPHVEGTRSLEALARQICSGLSADTTINPRRLKRFLNAFRIRQVIADARGIRLSPPVTAKLMLLEERYFDPDFRVLAGTPAPDIHDLLRRWEAWARNDDGAGQPDGVSDGSKEWARSAPSLAESNEDLGAYLYLAAAFTASASGGPISGKVARFADQVIAAKDADSVLDELMRTGLQDLDNAEVEQVMLTIAGRADTISPRSAAARLVLGVIEARPDLAPTGCQILDRKLTHIVDLRIAARLPTSPVEGVRQLAEKWATDSRLSLQVRNAMTAALKSPRRK
jgi:KAP family P-loop domain